MSFVLAILKYKIAIIFYSLILLIVYLNRKKFDVHGKFVYLYRTKIGVNFMDRVAKKAERLVKFLGHLGVIVGFAGMIFILLIILFGAYKLILKEPGAAGASPVVPGLPIAGTGLVFPLITGWIVIFIIILVHEFSHGIVASAYKIKLKNSGIAFFGPILGAFVEPDEKKLAKQKDWVQHSIFAAGPLANFLTVFVVFLALLFVVIPIVNSLYDSEGIIINPQPGLPADKAGITNNTLIIGINDKPIFTTEDLQRVMENVKPNQWIELKSNFTTYTVITIENPDDPSKAYLGVSILGEKLKLKRDNALNNILSYVFKWIGQFLWWLYFLSLNIGLINLLPIFITDGARMLKVFFNRMIPNNEKSTSIWLFANWISLLSLLILLLLPFFRWLGSNLIGTL